MPVPAELLQKGRYRVDPSVAEHVAGTIYPAYDTTSDSKVVVKEILVRLNKVTTLSQQENTRLGFENTARRLSELHHGSILRVTDFYSEVGRQYLVMESIDGEGLLTILEKERNPLPVEKALEWADQLLDAVNFLHNQNPPVLHRNICPRNIDISGTGQLKLSGLTITDENGNEVSTALSEANEGSLNFSPLEVIWESLDAASQKVIVSSYDERSEKTLKEPADVRSDLYSVGATLYYLLTASVPVDPLERSIELLEGRPDPLRAPNSIDVRIAPEISDVVMRALEIKRENRFDSAMIMRQVLRTAVVRVKEREAAELQEIDEAAELLRRTQHLKEANGPVESFAPPAPAASVQRDGSLEAEVPPQSLDLEKAADVTFLSNDLRATGSPDDLLGITAEAGHSSPLPAENFAPEDDIHLSIKPQPRAKIDLRELAKAPATSNLTPLAEADPQKDEEFLLEAEPAEEYKTSPAPTVEPGLRFSSYSYDEEPRRSGLPIPLMAGAAALILMAAVVGYMFLVGSNPTAPDSRTESVPQQATPVEKPAAEVPIQPVEQQPDEQLSSFNSSESQPVETTTETVEPRPATKPAQSAKAKPNADARRAPAPAKKVTVDDLINDN